MNFEFLKTRGLSIFFLVCMLGMSLPFAVQHGARLFKALSSLGWQESEAEVLSTHIQSQGIPGKHGRCYETSVSYRYAADGTSYESDRVSFDPAYLNTYEKTLGLAARYPQGAKIRIFYNPRHPEESVLEPGVHWSHFVFFSAGIFFTALSIVFGVLLLRASHYA